VEAIQILAAMELVVVEVLEVLARAVERQEDFLQTLRVLEVEELDWPHLFLELQ
jgi:hypothetical protein